MSETAITATITIDAQWILPTDEARPKEEVKQRILEEVRSDWIPEETKDGEYGCVEMELTYTELER